MTDHNGGGSLWLPMGPERIDRRKPPERAGEGSETTYPMRAAARLTGISPDLLRAWERRYRIVEPVRTPGGTRRYRASDLERLRLVKAAVDAGHRISEVASLGVDELERRALLRPQREPEPVEDALAALTRLDGSEAERIASLQLAALGPVRFAREFALPLLAELGAAWKRADLCVASEHLGTALIRSLLGAALRTTVASRTGPRIVFGTPPGERHEIGLLAAAVAAVGAGADATYLGPDLPVGELLLAVATLDAAALVIALVALPAEQALSVVRETRSGLPAGVELWVGGAGAAGLPLPPGVRTLDAFDAVERAVARLALRSGIGGRP